MTDTTTPRATDDLLAREPAADDDRGATQITPEASPEPVEARRSLPTDGAFADFVRSGWAPRDSTAPAPRAASAHAASRRAEISALHPGVRLIVPAGPVKQRANDTDFPFRAHSAFSDLTGWGSDAVPDSVLVLEPHGEAHEATLFFLPAAGRDTIEFFANAAIGEFWVGPRPTLEQVAADLGVATAPLSDLAAALGDTDDIPVLLVEEADAALTTRLGSRLAAEKAGVLARDLAELRLVKDAWEVGELRAAIDATSAGFDEVIADLAAAKAHPRGERVIDGTFWRRARMDGNQTGYDTIAASGAHACFLHWTRNDGPVRDGDLVLIDAGVEVESLYTADITRTLPVNGVFSEVQRRVYDAVLEAADAALAVVRPGIVFKEVHAAAMEVIARRTAEWGLLPVSAEESLEADKQFHRRWMVHGTSHHLGLDVHDCAAARRDFYHDGVVREGMVFTIEPGLYFQPDDELVPEELRGIGVRIEDDILVTADGATNLSAHIPRTADDVEAWIARLG